MNDMIPDVLQKEEEETSEETRPIETNKEINRDENDFLLNEVNEIVGMIDELDGSIEGLEEEIDTNECNLSWEDDISFAVELAEEQDKSYEPNYFFLKQIEATTSPVRAPRPQRKRRATDHCCY